MASPTTTDLPSRATTGFSTASEDAIPEVDPSSVCHLRSPLCNMRCRTSAQLLKEIWANILMNRLPACLLSDSRHGNMLLAT